VSRHFSRAASDYVRLTPGTIGASDGGPVTVVTIWKPGSSADGSLYNTVATGPYNMLWFGPTSGSLWFQYGGSFGSSQPYTSGDGWRIDAWSKTSGTSAVRGHYALWGGGWTHTDYSVKSDTTAAPVDYIMLGRSSVVGVGTLEGDIAVVMAVGRVLSDAEIEALTGGLIEWVDAVDAVPGTPAGLWPLNQAAVSDPVVDITGDGADQSAISGTSVVADPPGFSWDLSTAVTCDLGATVSTATALFGADVVANVFATIGVPAVAKPTALFQAQIVKVAPVPCLTTKVSARGFTCRSTPRSSVVTVTCT
jgi:hypothetical protein